MKKMYWRRFKGSRWILSIVCLFSVAGLAAIQQQQSFAPSANYALKTQAVKRTSDGFQLLKEERLRRGYAIDGELDPLRTGVIGLPESSVTTVDGHLRSKQTSANPYFAAVVVDMLCEAGVQRGDVVAVGCSGSFPAVNVALFAALDAVGAEPLTIASASASQYGANIPEFLWIDMHRLLNQLQVLSSKPLAASIGGAEDVGAKLSKRGVHHILHAIKRNHLPLIEGEDYHSSLHKRMEVYQRHAAGRPIKAYVNVGGGAVSLGRSQGQSMFQPGVNLAQPKQTGNADSVMTRFAQQGVPVIHLSKIENLAAQYGLPIGTERPATLPRVMGRAGYNRVHAAGLLIAVMLMLYLFVRSDVGFRLIEDLTERLLGLAASYKAPPIQQSLQILERQLNPARAVEEISTDHHR